MSCADLTDRELRLFSCTLHSAAFMRAWTLKRTMCWCDGGQEQQSAESLIITGGKCGAFLGAVSASVRAGGGGGDEMPG